MTTVRTRFAPSPTGFLHVGGARTAIFAWAYARHHGGQFILRVEDTDQERSTEESVKAILDGMAWLNLQYDEGPFFQTKRMNRYHEVIAEWLKKGIAYRCYCSKERVEKLREAQMTRGEKPRYDGHCRELNCDKKNEPFVVRFKNPTDGEVVFDDLIRGRIAVRNAELDDLVIARSDGYPTYNFCVVVDDSDMKITDVIRGDDHINNTPRQINMLHAMKAAIPRYAHVPMILGADGKRFSKRHGAVSVLQFKDDGYLPEALFNYLVRLGWSHGDQEIFSHQDVIRDFSLERVNHAPARFDMEKLNWLNQQYLKNSDKKIIEKLFVDECKKINVDVRSGPVIADVLVVQLDRAKTIVELAEKSRYFFEDAVHYDADAVQKNITTESKIMLQKISEQLEKISDAEWKKEKLHQVIAEVAESLQLKLGKIAQPLRIAVSGGTTSPSIDITLQLIGKKRVLARLRGIF